jgi:predicted HicB family RNase H-like nuclease
MSEGDTAEEALAMIQEAMELWLEVSLEEGIPIPEPRPDEDYSGKFVVRVPRSLHRELVDEAQRQGASLNQFINAALARSVGRSVFPGPTVDEEPGWPGLKTAVRHVLQVAGLSEEAGELDERLFAGWASECLAQAESALAGGYLRDAIWCLRTLAHGLEAGRDRSPVLSVFHRTVSLLHQQAEATASLQQGVINDLMVRSRISRLAEGTNRPLAQMVIQEERVAYSATSTQTEEPVQELFRPAQRGSQW